MRLSLTVFPCMLLMLAGPAVLGQSGDLHFLRSTPSQEAYDLLCDQKGYIWLGHDQGLSRYDGGNYVHFSHPRQNSWSISGLVEDPRGRLWCHNFNGQIFYVDSLRMHLLDAYDSKKESSYPRIGICGNELVATSKQGIFVTDLASLRSRYLSFPDGTYSLSVVGDQVVTLGPRGWGLYDKKKGIRPIPGLAAPTNQTAALQPRSFRDTIYLITNPNGIYYKLLLRHDSIVSVEERQAHAFLNSITVNRGRVWVHTKKKSFTEGGESIEGQNLSSLVQGIDGLQWVSSLQHGIGVRYPLSLEPLPIAPDPGDRVISLTTENGKYLCGTQRGWILYLDTSWQITRRWQVGNLAGAVEDIFLLPDGTYMVSASVGLYHLDTKRKDLVQLSDRTICKDIASTEDYSLIASTSGILRYYWKTGKLDNSQNLGNKPTRCRSLALLNKEIFAAFSDGLYRMNDKAAVPVTFGGQPIYATSLRAFGDRVLIATYNQGLLSWQNGKIRQLTTADGLQSNRIRRIAGTGDTCLLLYYDRIQAFDPYALKPIPERYPLQESPVLDAAMGRNQLKIVTAGGVFRYQPIRELPNHGGEVAIDRIIINGTDTTWKDEFDYTENSIHFNVSLPFFSRFQKLTYRFRLQTPTDSSWRTAASSTFNFFSLDPGSYRFEIMAVDETGKPLTPVRHWAFRIQPPWFQTPAFQVSMIILLLLLLFFGFRFYYARRLQKQRAVYLKLLAVQQERHRISTEMHDDIGASLSGLRLQAEMTMRKSLEPRTKADIERIHQALIEVTDRMREVIWSLNPENDKLENLAAYLEKHALRLFESSPIRLHIQFSRDLPLDELHGETRRQIYLTVKEALHNVIRHSNARNCWLQMQVHHRWLMILIRDDGRGIPEHSDPGNGLRNMRRRMEEVGGKCFLSCNKNGTAIELNIPLK